MIYHASVSLVNRFEQAVVATSDLARRAGAIEFKVEHSNIAPSTQWFAVATFRGPSGRDDDVVVKKGSGSDLLVACDRLAVELLDGAVCRHCNHVISVYGGDSHFCRWRRVGDKWSTGCGYPLDKTIEMVARA